MKKFTRVLEGATISALTVIAAVNVTNVVRYVKRDGGKLLDYPHDWLNAFRAGQIAHNCTTGCVVDEENKEIRPCFIHSDAINKLYGKQRVEVEDEPHGGVDIDDKVSGPKITVEYIAQPFDQTMVVEDDNAPDGFREVLRTSMEPHTETRVIEGTELESLMDHMAGSDGSITKPSELTNNPAFPTMEDVLVYHLEIYVYEGGSEKVTITNYTVED